MMTNQDAPEASCIGPDPHPGMIQLPVAPRINHRIRFSALNSKKPPHIMPQAAVAIVEDLVAKGATADTVLLHGPGDPLADIELTLDCIAALKERFPELNIVVRTLGIGGLRCADKLQKAGVKEIEITVEAVDTTIAEAVYAWIRPGFKTLKLAEAAQILCTEQKQAILAFKDAGMHLRVISTLYPTANDEHLKVLARTVTELGADEMVLHPYSPEPEADITLPEPTGDTIQQIVAELSSILPVYQGRPAAAAGTIQDSTEHLLPKPQPDRPNIAVVSSNGMDIDLHLGQAPQLLVYGPRNDGLNCLLECRPAPEAGAGKDRWDQLAGSIPDCFALLAASAGERPQRILNSHGIQVVITQDNIEGTVDKLYGGGKKGRKQQPLRS